MLPIFPIWKVLKHFPVLWFWWQMIHHTTYTFWWRFVFISKMFYITENNGFPENRQSGLRLGPNKDSGRDRPRDGSSGSGWFATYFDWKKFIWTFILETIVSFQCYCCVKIWINSWFAFTHIAPFSQLLKETIFSFHILL